MRRDVYYGELNFYGAEHRQTLISAGNYAGCLFNLEHFKEGKALLIKTMPVALRVLGEGDIVTLNMRSNYAAALVNAGGATLDDFREAVTTLEDAERIARRVLGGVHPETAEIEVSLRAARAALRARETPSPWRVS